MKLIARYRRHGDTHTEPVEVIIEADTYEAARDEARARTAEGDDLLSVQTLED